MAPAPAAPARRGARERDPLVQPFLKWAGGKRQLLPELRNHVPADYQAGKRRYFEPFLGGGAMLFDLQPRRAVVNDANPELINAYEVIRDDVDSLIGHLGGHRNDEDYYYAIRELDRGPGFARLSKLERASRILYLNKTCYNGLFRVNGQGQFNVPFGRYRNPAIVNAPVLRAVSRYLREAEIEFACGDFADCARRARAAEFLYFDPPYHPVSETASFTGYASEGFAAGEQIRLRDLCLELDARGCRFLLSNSHCPFILDLYGGKGRGRGFLALSPRAARAINSVAGGRGPVLESLIKNFA